MDAMRRFIASGDPGAMERLQADAARAIKAIDDLATATKRARAALQRHPSRPDLAVAEADMILYGALPQAE